MTNIRSTMLYAAFALVCLLVGTVLTTLFLWHGEKLVALGLIGNLNYSILVLIALFASLVLVGLQRSRASYIGKQLGGKLEVSGAGVVFFLVIILGHYAARPLPSNFPFTVYVHGSGGPHDLSLRGAGYVVLDIGGHRWKAPVGNDGDAFFMEIPANFLHQSVSVGLDADGYELIDPDQKVILSGGSAYLQVRRLSTRLSGHARDAEGRPLEGVKISVGGLSTTTDVNGFFSVLVLGTVAQADLTLQAVAPGYETWTDYVVPNSNEISIVLYRRR